jgi:hypothetical protein
MAFVCLTALGALARAEEPDYSRLCAELKKSGFPIVDSGVAYGVPFVKVKIPRGGSITALCRRVPTFEKDFFACRNRLAFFNALHHSYVKTKNMERHSIVADTLVIPLDLRKVPDIFPARDESLARENRYLIVDIGKGFLALYAKGDLQRVFPVSAGVAGKKTPLMDFRIQKKAESHWSSIYETWMPWSLQLQGPYFIHGGALPGQNDSAGCVRMLIDDARELYQLVDVGTPGRIIQTSKLEKVYPAPFCR